MKLLVATPVVILVSFVLINQLVETEKSPTVFVLDTSDSDSNESLPPTTTTRAPPDETANTKIIGDDTDQQQAKKQSSSSSSPYEQKQPYQRPNQSHQQANSSNTNCTNPRHQHQHHGSEHELQHGHQESLSAQQSDKHQQESTHCSQNDEAPPAQSSGSSSGKHRDNSSSRNLDPESEAPKKQRERSQRSTTSSPANSHDGQASNQNKIQERLLISISNSDDESYQHQPPKAGSPSTSSSVPGLHNDESQPPSPSHNQQQNKRKPSIMISIQDSNKPHGGAGGTPAVILRPGEDGQSIVISTVNGHGGQSTQKFKPSSNGDISIPIALAGGSINSNNQRDPPYREPANNPLQSIIQQSQRPPVATTRRPQHDPYQDPVRPAQTSTLTDERPQRPSNNLDEPIASSYETTSRPHSKPAQQQQQQQQQDEDNGPSNQNSNQDTNAPSQQDNKSRYPLNERNCGLVHETRIVGGEEAKPEDFMWMVAIIKSKPRDGDPRPFCGGSLITRRHILTAAHCLENLAPRDVLVRLGSYDFEDTASSSSSDYAIDQFRVPAQYSKKTHAADIAIMRLKTPLSLTDNYKTVCMPQPRRSYVGALGTVTGYGSQSQTFRRAAPKLRQVTVPIWENRKCSIVYKKNLTDSFLCAGYEEGGKDACQGDSGGPLMTDGPEQKLMLVGVVSHGIGCGAPGYPGVYTRTSTFLDWIEKNTRE